MNYSSSGKGVTSGMSNEHAAEEDELQSESVNPGTKVVFSS